MSRQEMIDKLDKFCSSKDECDKCLLHSYGQCDFNSLNDLVLCEMVSKIPQHQVEVEEVEEVKETPTPDNVNHPEHYNNGGMECIDEMILLFGKDAVKHFCLCNAWKYRRRALFKNGEEDINKSHWYIQKYKELSDNER